MRIRYFEVENDRKSVENMVCETNNTKIIPRKDEKVFIGSDFYKVDDVFYAIDYKDNESDDVKLVMIDVFLVKLELQL